MSSAIAVQLARFRGANMGDPIGDAPEKGITVRPTSTANFYIDSTDKPSGFTNAGDFIITKTESLFNGFFNRIAVNEVVMDWGLPNVAQWWGNNFLTVSVDAGGGTGTTYTVTLDDGFYSTYEALKALVTALNAAPGQTATFSIGQSGTQFGIIASQPFLVAWEQSASAGTVPAGTAPYYDPGYAMARALFSRSQLYTGALPVATTNPLFATDQVILSPLILGTRYVDIVSPQLTYNQDLKDNSSAQVRRDVLYRWYLADDNVPSQYDQILTTLPVSGAAPAVQLFEPLPFPILQGYRSFLTRRAVPFPKQILWNPAQPIGNVSFQSYDDRGRLIDVSKFTPSANYQFQLSMLLSEN